MIIGITGTLGAGKGTVVDFLKKKGFSHYSVRDFLTEEIRRRGLEVNRDNMILVANDLRAKYGASHIAEKLYNKAALASRDVVIESLRCPGEVEALRGKDGFVLWAVDADIETRYSRITERKSSTDNVSFQDFARQEGLEMENRDPLKQNLKVCIEMADHVFRNDWTIAELHGKVEKVLDSKLGAQGVVGSGNLDGLRQTPGIGMQDVGRRLTWDEYFMKLAALVAERSTCLRHNIGAIIVRDKRVIATGYNGAAKGVANCCEVGCVKDREGIKSGDGHNVCPAVHAEMNAIVQGATLGTSIEGTTMYCTHTPCSLCARLIVNSGIRRVVSYQDYSDEGARDFLRSAGVVLDKVDRPMDRIRFVD